MRLLRAVSAVGVAVATAIVLPLAQGSAATSSGVSPDFVVTPSSSPVGTYLTVTLLKPCPTPPAGDVGNAYFEVVFPPGEIADIELVVTIPAGQTVGYDLPTYSDDPFTAELAPGTNEVVGECDQYPASDPGDEVKVKTLTPATFSVTPSVPLTLSTTVVAPGGFITVSPTTPCPASPGGGDITIALEYQDLFVDVPYNAAGNWAPVTFQIPGDAILEESEVDAYCDSDSHTGDFSYRSTFFDVGPAVVSGVAPSSGPAAGGTAVTVTGVGLADATQVLFGSTPGTNLTVLSDNHLTVTSPRHSTGAANVHVVSAGGKSLVVGADVFTYLAVPAVTGVSPAQGNASGGTTVTLTGHGFTGTTQVLFGSTAGTNLTVASDSQLTVTSPRHALGPINVHVVTPGGRSAVVSADLFSYQALPVVTGLSPASGPHAGGTTVTVTGTGFSGATQVLFGSTPGTNVVVVSSTQITVTAPHHAAGPANVHVVTPIGKSAAASGNIFTYQ